MAARNQKSSTLPSNLRHAVRPTEESEGFLRKLKKKFKLKKSKYHVDVNLSECENVSAVSFRKRESREVLEDDAPWALRDSQSHTRSPRLTKSVFGRISDKSSLDTGIANMERKLSNPEMYTRNLQSSESSFQRSSLDAKAKAKFTNEYSPLAYEIKDGLPEKSLNFRDTVTNNCILQDDRAVDLDDILNDTKDINVDNRQAADNDTMNLESIDFDPGYEKLPDKRPTKSKKDTKDVGHMFEIKVKRKHEHENGNLVWHRECDPKYQSIDEAKAMQGSSGGTCDDFKLEFDPGYQSIKEAKRTQAVVDNDLIDPGYQSVADVKERQKAVELSRSSLNKDVDARPDDVTCDHRLPPKTYNKNQSIESLDEPGYESLQDVKKRIEEQNFDKPKNSMSANVAAEKGKGVSEIVSTPVHLNNSARETVIKSFDTRPFCNRLSAYGRANREDEFLDRMSMPFDLESSLRSSSKCFSTRAALPNRTRSKSGDVSMHKSDSLSGIKAFTQTALSLTNIATLLTGPGHDKRRQKEKKAKSGDDLYSKVRKTSREDYCDLYSSVNKVKKTDESGMQAQIMSETSHSKDTTRKAAEDGYDSDTELMLDPGYAECADAIKGYIPYTVYSEGSGSKMSSCTSLDLSAEDFTLEPGYAECADAIKTGAIKKISVSREHLVDHPVVGKHMDHRNKEEQGSEIYANPQILFRKKSKMLEDSSKESNDLKSVEGVETENSGDEKEISLSIESSSKLRDSKNKDTLKTKQEKSIPPEAPPLPARNYSLYLDNEEAESIVQEVLKDCDNDQSVDNLTDAFEEESLNDVLDDVERFSGTDVDIDDTLNNVNEISEKGVANSTSVVNVKDVHFCHDEERKLSSETKRVQSLSLSEQISNSSGRYTQVSAPSCFDSQQNNAAFKGTSELSFSASAQCENCLHVTVTDHSGKKIVLSVTEKEESAKTRNRREQAKKISCICEEKEKSDKIVQENTFLHVAEINKTYQKTEACDGGAESPEVKGDRTEKTETAEGDSGTIDNAKQCDREKESSGLVEITSSDLVEASDVKTDPDSFKPEQAENSFGEDTSDRTGQIPANTSLGPADSSDLDLNLLSVTPIRMKILSVDSDCDMFNTEDLPKLEINESDLDSAFDSSDNSNNLDIETEKADIDRLTERLKNEDLSSVFANIIDIKNNSKSETSVDCFCETKCGGNEIDNPSKTQEISENTGNESTDTLTSTEIEMPKLSEISDAPLEDSLDSKDWNVSESFHSAQDASDVFSTDVSCDTSGKRSTLESRVCVIDLETSVVKDVVADLSEVISEELSVINDVFDSDLKESSSKEVEQQRKDFSKEMHLQYEREHPNLYEDNEPTHMTLSEAMSRASILCSKSDSSDLQTRNSVRPDTLTSDTSNQTRIQTQSTADALTPPPRPPPVASGQSSRRVTTPGQSVHLIAASSPNDAISSASFLMPSDDEAPPVVPPRVKPVRTPKHSKHSGPPPQDFLESMRQLKDCGWYWGPLSWEEAELKLSNKPEGSFLVRDSSDDHYLLSLSFKNLGRVHHTRIEHHRGNFSFWSQPDSHGKATIKEFIEQCVENSRNGRFLYFIRPSGPGSPPMPIQLLDPVSRFVQKRSLQHMCRFRILQLVRRDHIDHLPIPKQLKQYLQEAQYYVEYLDD